MAEIVDSRKTYEATLQHVADTTVHWVPPDASAESMDAAIVPFADVMLRRHGAHELLMSRLERNERRLWMPSRSSSVLLNAQLLPPHISRYPAEEITLIATRHTRGQNLGRFGLRTLVGHRVRGSNMDVVALGCDPELAFTANAIVSWRQQLEAEEAAARRLAAKTPAKILHQVPWYDPKKQPLKGPPSVKRPSVRPKAATKSHLSVVKSS